MIIDFLIARDGLRIDDVELHISGVRLRKNPAGGLTPDVAASVSGHVRLAHADLVAAFARPEILDQLLGGVSGIARPEIALTDAEDGGVKITGSIELMGRRFPVAAFSRLALQDGKVVVTATQLEGLPMLGGLTSRLPSLALPLVLPAGLSFTDVRTVPGAIVVSFAGTDVPLTGQPALPVPAPSVGTPHGSTQGKPTQGRPTQGKPTQGKPTQGKPTQGRSTERKPRPGPSKPD